MTARAIGLFGELWVQAPRAGEIVTVPVTLDVVPA